MNNKEIANVLYNMCIDMDNSDYSESKEDEILKLEIALDNLQSDILRNCLEIIALKNEE